MNLILNILFIYIALYSIFFLIMALNNLRNKKFSVQKKYSNISYQNKLCVIIYSHDNKNELTNLLNLISQQNYSPDNYVVYVILDNCSDDSQNQIPINNNTLIFNINDQGTVGKDQAISILLEKLSENKICDAFVFLDVNRFIKEDFLDSINTALLDSPAISGNTILLGENLNIRQCIKKTYHKYYENFLQRSRAILNLAMNVDSNIFIIRHELLAKIGYINFKDINCELKYSLLLSKLGHKCSFNPNVKTYINVDDFKLRIPNLSARLDLFKEGWAQTLVGANPKFCEHIYSLLSPNIIVLILAYEFILEYSYNYCFIVDFSVVLLCLCALVLGFAISLINSNLKGKEYLYLILYPIYSIAHIFKNFPVCRFIRNKTLGISKPASVEKFIVDVEVTDGKRIIPCKLELISESGLAKVKFSYKKKKFTTKTHLRMIDAITEIINKLADFGLTLKICQTCANFSQNLDGSTNMIKGFCNQQFAVSSDGQIPTFLWNSCKGFSKIDQANIIDEINK